MLCNKKPPSQLNISVSNVANVVVLHYNAQIPLVRLGRRPGFAQKMKKNVYLLVKRNMKHIIRTENAITRQVARKGSLPIKVWLPQQKTTRSTTTKSYKYLKKSQSQKLKPGLSTFFCSKPGHRPGCRPGHRPGRRNGIWAYPSTQKLYKAIRKRELIQSKLNARHWRQSTNRWRTNSN